MKRFQPTVLVVLALAASSMVSLGEDPATAFAKELVYQKQDVDTWLNGKNRFAQYSSGFGWLLNNSLTKDGADGSACRYTYNDGGQGCRKMINHADKPCRINTYGNSFTQCHQVSDGETWQEVLAAHIGEPMRNFGVGGWSVYQAYLRMLREEEKTPADYMVFNIYSDDHYRNLDACRSIRVTRMEGGFGEVTLPYVAVNLDKNTFIEHPNPCPTPESVYNLCDVDWVLNRFKDDFVFKMMLMHRTAATAKTDSRYDDLKKLSTTFGINTRVDNAAAFSEQAWKIHLDAALFATEQIVERIEKFAKENNKRVLYVLSYNSYEIGRMLKEGERFDADFIQYLEEKGLPYVDLMQEHVEDYRKYSCGEEEYLEQYFIGHYNPRGNFFHAWSIKDEVVDMLDPKPESYK